MAFFFYVLRHFKVHRMAKAKTEDAYLNLMVLKFLEHRAGHITSKIAKYIGGT